jgi:high affinity Mn2+ porin
MKDHDPELPPGEYYRSLYSLNVFRSSWVTFDMQRIQNPAYNADRGPVNVESARLHAEF